jgi:hypothetical protein
MRRWNKDGEKRTSPGNRCEKKRATSRKKERSDSLPPQLLKEREGEDLVVGEPLEGDMKNHRSSN